MGREIRKVPPHWEHPKDEYGEYIPMFGDNYVEVAEEWIRNFEKWQKGDRNGITFCEYYWDWDPPPNEDRYVNYREEDATWFQLYQNVSEGTPLTPPFKTRKELIDYLVNEGDFWRQKDGKGGYRREDAEKFVKVGYAPSMVISMGSSVTTISNGIEGVSNLGN